uniref:Dynein regulatory complex protein 9 n=1 Tax=Anopheles atroparvus TaxID=41427 RepID=A0A182J0T8_ANOAO
MQRQGVLVRLLRHTRRFIVNLLTTTSAHGARHLVHGGLHILERLVWLSCITVGVYGMVALSQRIWNRFQTSPTVISMDRNMYLWNTSFPSLTICLHRRIDEEKLAAYIRLRGFDEDDAEQFREFVVLLANVSYRTFLELPMYKTFGIAGYDYMELLHNLSWSFLPQVISGAARNLDVQPTVTELGLCLAVNSRIAQYTSYEYWQARRWDEVHEPTPLVVHPLDGEVYGQLVKLESSYEVFFHGSMEVAEISKRQYSFQESYYTTVELMALEIITSRNARELSVSQRQCRFTHEADTLIFSPVYSYNLCRMECRMKLASKLCGCVPHFYRAVGKGNFRYRICDFEGLRCLGQRSDCIKAVLFRSDSCFFEQEHPKSMAEVNENYRPLIGAMIEEGLRKLQVLSWCSQNQQLIDSTQTYSIAALLQDKKQGLQDILETFADCTVGHLPSSTSARSSTEHVFRASSSSGEERVYYDRVEYLERSKEIRRLMKRFKVLKYQCHELNHKLHVESQIEMTRHRFIKHSEASSKELLQQTITERVDQLQADLKNIDLDKTRAIQAAAAIEKFYRWKLESTEQQIEDWMNRFDREKEDQDSRFQKARATEKYWNELKISYDQRQQEVDKLERELVRWEAELKHKELCGRLATRLQAWWRGVMVRRGLGRFGPTGGKKAKSTGKGGKKSKKI